MFYHVSITPKSNPTHEEIMRDLTKNQLDKILVHPYETGLPITINQSEFSPDDIGRIRITESEVRLIELIKVIQAEDQTNSKLIFGGASFESRAADRTKNVTSKFISGPPGSKKPTKPVKDTGKLSRSVEESLEIFKTDYKKDTILAFIMMQFGDSKPRKAILEAVKSSLYNFGIIGLRADEKQYNDDLFYNILTYIHGCHFGIAVFERIEKEEFNPNVSLEVGYMLAIEKPVCLLKDQTLNTLSTDLMGKMYKTFDVHDPPKTIKQGLGKWLHDKGIVP